MHKFTYAKHMRCVKVLRRNTGSHALLTLHVSTECRVVHALSVLGEAVISRWHFAQFTQLCIQAASGNRILNDWTEVRHPEHQTIPA